MNNVCRENENYFSDVRPVFSFDKIDDRDCSASNEDLLMLESPDDTESVFDLFERFSPIYIDKHHNQIIFSQNTFTRNFATFGGAICVNAFYSEDIEGFFLFTFFFLSYLKVLLCFMKMCLKRIMLIILVVLFI